MTETGLSPNMLTIEQAAQRLGLSYYQVYQMCRMNAVKFYRQRTYASGFNGLEYLIYPSEVARLERERAQALGLRGKFTQPRLLSTAEAAPLLFVCQSAVQHMMKRGKLRVWRPQGKRGKAYCNEAEVVRLSRQRRTLSVASELVSSEQAGR